MPKTQDSHGLLATLGFLGMTAKKSPPLKIDILTLFPKMFTGPFDESIIKRAVDKKLVEIDIHNLRNWAEDKHKTVDDRPYGGGVGMIIMIQPVYDAVEDLKIQKSEFRNQRAILLSPQGQPLNQKKAEKLSELEHLILICGRYEGVDERIRGHIVDEEISIGDYVLTGGEIPAMVLIDTIVRLIPGVLEKPEALDYESFSFKPPTSHRTSHLPPPTSHLLEFPQYTRPENFRGYKVPKVLLSGDHKKIAQWRKEQSLLKTRQNRPDLLE